MTTCNRWVLAATIMFASAAWSLAAPALGEKPTKWEYAELEYTWSSPLGQREKIKVSWVTADRMIEAEGWEGIAEKFKAPAVKDGTTTKQSKLRLLNYLGSEGWEMVDHVRQSTGVRESWSFKRRVP